MGGFAGTVKAMFGRDNGDGAQGQTDDDFKDKANSYITDRWNEVKNAYIIFHQNCWETLLHYVGESWIEYDNTRKIMTRTQPEDEWVPMPRINKFSPTIDSIVSNFNTAPEVEAVVKSDLNGDLRAHGIAEICTALGEHFRRVNGLSGSYKNQPEKVGIAAQMFVLFGNVFTVVEPRPSEDYQIAQMQSGTMQEYTCYVCGLVDEVEEAPPVCPHCGGPLAVKPVERQVPTLDEQGQQAYQSMPQFEICCDIGNPLYHFPRPGSLNDCDSPYHICAKRMTLEAIKQEFKFDAKADMEFGDGYNVTFEHALSYYYVGFSQSSLASKDSALVKRLYIEPGKVADFPGGVYAAMVNGEVVAVSTWAEKFNEHPMTKAGYLPVPTLYFDRSVAFDLVNIDKEVNRYESLIALHAMTSAVEPVVIDENTVVSEITGRADKIIRWRSLGPGTSPPHRMQHGTLDAGTYTKLEQLYSEYEHISGAVSVYKGQQPGSVTAASAISDLQSQAERMFSRPVQAWNDLWAETVRKGVSCMHKRYTREQVAEIIGPDRTSQIEDFFTCDLENTIDWVSTGMGLPRTRNERKKEMMDLFDRGALDVSDPNVRQNLFELFGDTGMMKQFNADATRARYENKMMQQGQPAIPMPEIEDLQTHFFIHAEQIKSLEFERWNPEAKQLLMQHTIATKQEMLMMAAQMGAIGGAPLGPSAKPNSAGGLNAQAGKTPPTTAPHAAPPGGPQ